MGPLLSYFSHIPTLPPWIKQAILEIFHTTSELKVVEECKLRPSLSLTKFATFSMLKLPPHIGKSECFFFFFFTFPSIAMQETWVQSLGWEDPLESSVQFRRSVGSDSL